jgi:hypothetical protein
MGWALNNALWDGRPVLVTGGTGNPLSSIEAAWSDRVTWVDGVIEDQMLLERALGEHRGE